MTAQQQDWLDAEDPVFEPVHVPGDGPHDVEDLDPEVTLGAGTVDFGAVRVPVPERGTVAVDPSEKGRMQAVHVSVPEGRLSVSALAAPKSSRLWPDLVKEIDASLREGGARVRSFQGDWGRELHATSGAATSLFVGVDGARWMLYGVATGPTRDAGALDEQLRRMMRGTIVVRGRSPYPVRTVLPLEVPGHLATSAPDPEASGSVVELRSPADTGHRSAPTAAYPAEPAPAPPTTALPTTALPTTAPPTTALPVAGPAAGWGSGWSPADELSAPEVSPPTTALPVHRAPAASGSRSPDVAPPTTALPVAPARGPVDGAPPWADPVHRVADPGGPLPLDAGPDPDDRPTDIRQAPVESPLTARWPAAGVPGGSETAPWALSPPPPGGRRRLREPGDHLPVSPGLTGPWAPWPDSPTGSGRAVGPAPRSNGHRPPAFPADPGGRRATERAPRGWEAPPVDRARSARRRSDDPVRGTAVPSGFPTTRPAADTRPDAVPAPPRTDRHRLPDPAPTEALAVVPEVLRVGRHAVADPAPDRNGRGAETQPWVAPRGFRSHAAPGPVIETAPQPAVSRPAVSQAESGLVTEPLPVYRPAAERPTGRHHRPD